MLNKSQLFIEENINDIHKCIYKLKYSISE